MCKINHSRVFWKICNISYRKSIDLCIFSDPFQPTSMKLSTPNLFSCPLCCGQQIAAILRRWGGSLPANPTIPKRPPAFPPPKKMEWFLWCGPMFGRCLVYFSEKKKHLETNILINQGLQSPELYESVCLRKNSYDIPNSAWCHDQPPPPALLACWESTCLALGFAAALGSFGAKTSCKANPPAAEDWTPERETWRSCFPRWCWIFFKVEGRKEGWGRSHLNISRKFESQIHPKLTYLEPNLFFPNAGCEKGI